MDTLKALNRKKIKEIIANLESVYGISNLKLDYVFYQNTKGKIYLLSNDFKSFDFDLKVNSLGMYFATESKNEIRLSVEGSQIIGEKAKENILELNDDELRRWLLGEDFLVKENLKGFVLIKNKDDFFGTGRIVNDKLLNYVPKDRRIDVI
ncbi:MAG: hypothetical protein CMH64_02785 [Nanoarchaeota archaeon]|nr:hypothetical protein [Nanoarchaeota archaeon]|tara:strand:- start:246 stop:698 length:453 start_codon:yes stop_codon:yes gene_type:complete